MNAVPDLVRRHPLSVAEYERMAEAGVFGENTRLELIEGELFDMAPIGPDHQGIVDLLAERFFLAPRQRAVPRVQGPIVLGDRSVPQPDLAVLRRRDDFYAGAHPSPPDVLLAVEVAQSSPSHDRDVKLPLYARHEVPEVWLVDVAGRSLTVYRGLAADGYRRQARVEPPGPLAPSALPDAAVDPRGRFG